MNGDAPLSWLMFFTLTAGVVVAAGFFLQFLRSRHNRDTAATALGGEHPRGVEPDGAGVELIGLFAGAILAMALLAFGYHSHSGSPVRARVRTINSPMNTTTQIRPNLSAPESST